MPLEINWLWLINKKICNYEGNFEYLNILKVVAVVVVGQANQRPETAAVASAGHEHVGGKDKNLRLTNLWRPLHLKQIKCAVLNPISNNTYYYNNIHIWRLTHWRKTFNQIVTKLGLIIAPALLVNLTSSFILLFKNLLRRKKTIARKRPLLSTFKLKLRLMTRETCYFWSKIWFFFNFNFYCFESAGGRSLLFRCFRTEHFFLFLICSSRNEKLPRRRKLSIDPQSTEYNCHGLFGII